MRLTTTKDNMFTLNPEKFIVSACVVLLTLTGCKTIPVAADASKLDVQVKWTEKSGCSRVSPPITLKGLPASTKFIEVRMVDLDLPTFNHGGGDIDYIGQTIIAEGSLKFFNGPCPPNPHNYKFTVNAINADKSAVVGVGEVNKRYPE